MYKFVSAFPMSVCGTNFSLHSAAASHAWMKETANSMPDLHRENKCLLLPKLHLRRRFRNLQLLFAHTNARHALPACSSRQARKVYSRKLLGIIYVLGESGRIELPSMFMIYMPCIHAPWKNQNFQKPNKMASNISSSCLLLFLMTLLVAAGNTAATRAQDEKDCTGEMLELAACIPYVSGGARKPTPECCTNTEEVRAREPKCLCLLIVESSNASLGLPINTTLALRMPAACNSDAKVSDCPRILNLAPGSPEAKIFEDASGGAPAAASSPPAPAHDSSDSGSKSAPTNACTILVGSAAAVGVLGLFLHIALHSLV